MAFNWTCPHCNSPQTVTDRKVTRPGSQLNLDGLAEGKLGFEFLAIGCANPDCLKATITAEIRQEVYVEPIGWRKADILLRQQLWPRGAAKSQPDYIPIALREDYSEACIIRDLSPKAAATLVRRCLQGMLHDFCGISKRTLAQEIAALRKALDDGQAPDGVTHESVDAIDAVRGIGNIGAHMEHDINLIVEVDADEAQLLIELVETLFLDWYVARHQRAARLTKIQRLAAEKQEARLGILVDTAGSGEAAP
jgi:hypothetical protein